MYMDTIVINVYIEAKNDDLVVFNACKVVIKVIKKMVTEVQVFNEWEWQYCWCNFVPISFLVPNYTYRLQLLFAPKQEVAIIIVLLINLLVASKDLFQLYRILWILSE